MTVWTVPFVCSKVSSPLVASDGRSCGRAAEPRRPSIIATNCFDALSARVEIPGTSAARVSAVQRFNPFAIPHAWICLTLVSPKPRGGTLMMRSRLTSSLGFATTRRYASTSLISLRL